MNENIIKEISNDLNVSIKQVESTLKLLEDGNTIPFIARYRKEATGNLDEEQIRKISDVYEYQVNLLKRKEDVIRLIDEKGLLTDELKDNIMKCSKLVEIEDIYRPFKEKKKTKATEAIKNGLEPLAKIIMSFPKTINGIEKFINENVKTKEEALMGAKYIIAEWISDNAFYRKWIRNYMYSNGIIISKLKKNKIDEDKVYEMYYEYSEAVKSIKPHRVLALNRGEKDDILSVKIDINEDSVISYLESKLIKNNDSESVPLVIDAIKDSLNRLIFPSVEREIRSELTDIASEKSIEVFMDNLEHLLLTPPMKDKMVLGLDPAFRTGCKLAVIDYTGKFIKKDVIYPHEPKNEYEESKKKVLDLIDKYNIDIIAIGNGTASRESEKFISDVIKESKRKVEYIIVNEAGASVYSASKLAIEEFPDLHVEERSAISIARRLQDPLSELVKVDSKSIGVGLYQHDVQEKRLDESLDFVVSKAVNMVGVNINTASPSLLKYVSGLNKKVIDKIISYRESFGKIKSREELKKKKVLTDKTYEQSIGFMRVVDGDNPLDKTSIHTESYDVTLKLLNELNLSVNDIGTNKIKEVLSNIDINDYSKKLNIDSYTLTDIVNALTNPLRDPRDDMPKPVLRSDILKLEDLTVGMKLQGTVRNVVDFGAFIDIGLKNDGLVHISKMSNDYIKHPSEVVSVGDIVDVYVDEIHLDKKKVSLSFIESR
ncbi:MAG: RNA-binding transcriptional accessory protein [Bacilli bacterium]|nr:RNA-binding transcriptional accessory protein [Bacilli bacterium]